MLRQAQAGRARGLLRFGVRRTLATALASGVAVGAASAWGWREVDETRLAMIVTCLSLPAGALAHYGVEVLTAVGRPRLALAIFKLFVPSLALIFVTILLAASGTVSFFIA